MTAALLGFLLLAAAPPADLVRAYVEDVLAGDPVAAAACWRDEDLASSRRLDVVYGDQPLKVDGDSPLWRARDALRAGTATWSVAEAPSATAGTAAVDLVLRAGSDEVRHTYTLVESGGGWRLASPVTLATAPLPATTGKYVVVHGSGAPVALLDSCVTAMAARLRVGPDRLAGIARGRFGYLVLPGAEVERLAGAPTAGVANLQHDVVVTSHPCHAHELAHLVVNAWLGELPLFTLPLLQEGAATHLGGRWGRHPRVLARVGRTTLADSLVNLDDLLTRDDFLAQSADVTYAAAGVFTGFLLDRFGSEGLRAAYLAASGTAVEVGSWSRDEVKARLANALGTSWDDVAASFAADLAAPSNPEVRPGALPSPIAFRVDAAGDSLNVLVEPGGGSCGFTVRSTGGHDARGALLFGGGGDDVSGNALFAEHFPGRPYRGESVGVLFSRDDVKVYDYRLQMLAGLHAEGFWPSATYATADGRTLAFTIAGDLVGSTVVAAGLKLEPWRGE